VNTIVLLSVNTGQAEQIGIRRGKPVMSGYRKRPVMSEMVTVGMTGISGDVQADLRVHGGPDKAVYAYSADHFAFWTNTLEPTVPYGPGSFAENLTILGVGERNICIGDIWQWGDAQIQVCQPRYPCFKMALATERPKIVRRFLAEGRSGIYFRVVQPGSAPSSGSLEVVVKDPLKFSVRDAALALYGPTDSERCRTIAHHPFLAERWRDMLLEAADYSDSRSPD
jgi:MOSC domain-containing protein YiiM